MCICLLSACLCFTWWLQCSYSWWDRRPTLWKLCVCVCVCFKCPETKELTWCPHDELCCNPRRVFLLCDFVDSFWEVHKWHCWELLVEREEKFVLHFKDIFREVLLVYFTIFTAPLFVHSDSSFTRSFSFVLRFPQCLAYICSNMQCIWNTRCKWICDYVNGFILFSVF